MDTAENIAVLDKSKKLYSVKSIGLSAFIGGPLAGCYMLAKNFENFGNKEGARKIFIIGAIATLVLFGSVAFIPSATMDKIPSFIIPLVYSTILFSYATKHQDKEIKEHLKNGGGKYSGWKAFGIGMLSLMLSVVYLAALIFILPENLVR